MPKTVSPEYQTYKVLEHWRRANSVRQIEKETAPLLHKSPLFSYLYGKTKKEYRAFPRRKNDQDPFLHPLNVILDLQKAKADEELTLCTGLIHDFIEEKVELFKITHHLKEDQKDIPSLDRYETEMLKELEEDLKRFCKEHHLSLEKAQ
jgi:hypothetical protein